MGCHPTHWLSYFSEGWVYHQPEYDINFAESWALRVERVRTGSTDDSHWTSPLSLMVSWWLPEKTHMDVGKKHHKSRSCSLGFLKFHGKFHGFSASSSEKSPYFSVNSHVCHLFYWASNVSPVSRKKSWPQPTCALCSVEPESPGKGGDVDWCSNKMRQFPYEKGGFAHENGWINHDLPWFTMIFPSKSIQLVEINYDLPSKIASFTANNEESCGFPHEKWWFFQQTCRCA